MADTYDEVKLIEIRMVVGYDSITAAYVDPNKIAGMLAEEKSLGGFLREMLFIPNENDDEELPAGPAMPGHAVSLKELDLLNGFEALVERAKMSPDEIRALICGIVVGFADRSGVSLQDLHADIDAAYAYKMAHTGRPS